MANMRTTVILKTDVVDSTPRTARLTQSEMGIQRKQHKRLISEIATKNESAIFQEEGMPTGSSVPVWRLPSWKRSKCITHYMQGRQAKARSNASVHLSRFDKLCGSKTEEIWVLASGKMVKELKRIGCAREFQELARDGVADEKYRSVFERYGVFRLLMDVWRTVAV